MRPGGGLTEVPASYTSPQPEGDDGNLARGRIRLEVPGRGEPVHPGQLDVHEDQGWRPLRRCTERIGWALDGADLVAAGSEEKRDLPPIDGVVFDGENPLAAAGPFRRAGTEHGPGRPAKPQAERLRRRSPAA